MRKIKFRGQNRLGRFVYGIPLLFDTNKDSEEVTLVSRYIAEDGAEHQEEWIVQKITIGQFTGLKDKLGKEIYEGDIVSSGLTRGVVVYNSESAYFMVEKPSGKNIELRFYSLLGIEVIGNIHDNPELLSCE